MINDGGMAEEIKEKMPQNGQTNFKNKMQRYIQVYTGLWAPPINHLQQPDSGTWAGIEPTLSWLLGEK
jgi:hypothetical protein